MEITKGSRLLINKYGKDITPNTLDYGSKSGEIAKELGCYFADHDISNVTGVSEGKAFYIDHISKVDKRVSKIVFTAHYSTELNSMLVEEFLGFLPISGVLLVILSTAYSLESFSLLPLKYKVVAEDKDNRIIKFVKEKEIPTENNRYLKEYTAQVQDKAIKLMSDPSCFSGSQLDLGTQALLEKVEWKEGPVLDIGCASGVIGIVANKTLDSKVTMTDVNLRALRWAMINVTENGVGEDVEIIPNYGLKELGKRNYYETILSNPPYHSDYSVAKGFIEEGYKMLKMGGTMWFVVKNPTWYQKKFASVFGGVKVIDHLGYSIVVAQKRPIVKKEKPQKTTKKHQKRLEGSKKKKHSRA